MLLGLKQEAEDTEFSALNLFLLVSLLQQKLTGIWKEEFTLLPVNANNRDVCLRVRHDVSRKELVVIGASRGRAPGAHITLNLPALKIRGPATHEV